LFPIFGSGWKPNELLNFSTDLHHLGREQFSDRVHGILLVVNLADQLPTSSIHMEQSCISGKNKNAGPAAKIRNTFSVMGFM
jgi:hypothetical protein